MRHICLRGDAAAVHMVRGGAVRVRVVRVEATVRAPPVAAVGVPQTSRGSVPGQPFVSVPLASNTSPAGRPETE